MPTSALAAVIGICATIVGIQTRFFSVLKADMRSMSGRIDTLRGHVERVEERLSVRVDREDEKLNGRISQVNDRMGRAEQRLNNRIDRVKETLNSRIDQVKEEFSGRMDRLEKLGGTIDLVSSDVKAVGREVAYVKGQWDLVLTFLPLQKTKTESTSVPS